MRNGECGMDVRASERRTYFNSAFRIPHSPLAVKHRRLFSAPGRRESEMSVRGSRGAAAAWRAGEEALLQDRKSTRLNSSHLVISYAVFCLKKKKKTQPPTYTAHQRPHDIVPEP